MPTKLSKILGLNITWLLGGIQNNPKAIKQVFRATVQLAKHFDLIGANLIAGDSTKLRAKNSKKNNFNPKKIDLHLKRIDEKLEQYSLELAKEDGDTASNVGFP